jgi:hypothetical protein
MRELHPDLVAGGGADEEVQAQAHTLAALLNEIHDVSGWALRQQHEKDKCVAPSFTMSDINDCPEPLHAVEATAWATCCRW